MQASAMFARRTWAVRISRLVRVLRAAVDRGCANRARRRGKKFHRKMTIENVNVRPFSVAVCIDGVRLLEPDGATVFA
jgi:hypothetical protein